MSDAITPFVLNVPQAELDDLKRRLANTRWAERETVDDWSQGAPLAKVRALCEYWAGGYDWRRCEAQLNGLGQFKTEIDGLGIHFLHVRSPHPNALPLLITHGCPGSVIEFLEVIGPLTDPVAHGGRAGTVPSVDIRPWRPRGTPPPTDPRTAPRRARSPPSTLSAARRGGPRHRPG